MRLIKRYENRKLYDTETSKYVALADIAHMVRDGEEVQVLDAKQQDITAQTLAQIIVEEQKSSHTVLPADLLHDLIRAGGQKVSRGVKQVQAGVEGFLSRSLDKLAPVRAAKKEMAVLKERIAQLEKSLSQIDIEEADASEKGD